MISENSTRVRKNKEKLPNRVVFNLLEFPYGQISLPQPNKKGIAGKRRLFVRKRNTKERGVKIFLNIYKKLILKLFMQPKALISK